MRFPATNMEFFARIFSTVSVDQGSPYQSFPGGIIMTIDLLYASICLIWLWQFSNSCFNLYLTLGPLHKGVFMSDKSSDKNGTLISGLRAVRKPFALD